PRRRADRGAQGHRGAPGAGRLRADHRPLPGLSRAAGARPCARALRRHPRRPAGEPVTGVPWQSLVDLDRLARWMDAQGIGEGAITDAAVLAGGTQNLLLRLQRSGSGYVLRRPPPHPRADGNETMRREMRVLAALADTDVPHPRFVAGCTDTEVLGA